MRNLTYHIGRLGEEEQLRFDFLDGLSRTVYERIQLGFIPMKLPVIDEAPYGSLTPLKNTENGPMKIHQHG